MASLADISHADFPVIDAFLDGDESPDVLGLITLINPIEVLPFSEGQNYTTAAFWRDDLRYQDPHSSVSSYSTARIRSMDTTYPIIYSMAISSDNLEAAHDIHT